MSDFSDNKYSVAPPPGGIGWPEEPGALIEIQAPGIPLSTGSTPNPPREIRGLLTGEISGDLFKDLQLPPRTEPKLIESTSQVAAPVVLSATTLEFITIAKRIAAATDITTNLPLESARRVLAGEVVGRLIDDVGKIVVTRPAPDWENGGRAEPQRSELSYQSEYQNSFRDTYLQTTVATAVKFIADLRLRLGIAELPNLEHVSWMTTGPMGVATTFMRCLSLKHRGSSSAAANELELIGISVHEVAHALAKSHAVVNDQGGELTVRSSRNGWSDQVPDRSGQEREPKANFRGLEEYAAASAEFYYYRSQGHTEASAFDDHFYRTTKHSSVSVDVTKLLLELYHPLQYRMCSDHYNKVGWDQFVVDRENQSISFPIMKTHTLGVYETAYSPYIAAFDELGKALYPNASNPALAMRDEALKAQATGERRPLLLRVKEAFGTSAVRLLANANPYNDSHDSKSMEYIFLNLFAFGGQLDEARVAGFRQEVLATYENWRAS